MIYMQCNGGKRYNWPILPYKDGISLVHLCTVYVEALRVGVFVLSGFFVAPDGHSG